MYHNNTCLLQDLSIDVPSELNIILEGEKSWLEIIGMYYVPKGLHILIQCCPNLRYPSLFSRSADLFNNCFLNSLYQPFITPSSR